MSSNAQTGASYFKNAAISGCGAFLEGTLNPAKILNRLLSARSGEEAGIDIRNAQPFGFGSSPELETFTFPNGHVAQHFVMNFYCRDFGGTPNVEDDESLALDWFQTDDLPEMLPNMRESVRAYQRFLSSGQFQLF